MGELSADVPSVGAAHSAHPAEPAHPAHPAHPAGPAHSAHPAEPAHPVGPAHSAHPAGPVHPAGQARFVRLCIEAITVFGVPAVLGACAVLHLEQTAAHSAHPAGPVHPAGQARFVRLCIEAITVFGVPAVLGACAVLHLEQTALLSMVVVTASLLLFFLGYEHGRPRLRDTMPVAVLAALAVAGRILFAPIPDFKPVSARPRLRDTMPVAVLAALAVAGRILFAPIPDFKPVSAIAIIAGAVFGRRNGFMVGALAALVSNFFFGQGPWTPWQMYAWGMVGYGAGLLAQAGLFERPAAVYAYGFAAPFGFGFIMNAWSILGFYGAQTAGGAGLLAQAGLFERPAAVYAYGFAAPFGFGFIMNAWSILGFYGAQTAGQMLTLYALALPFDIVHAIATVVFLLALWKPWRRKLHRVKAKYGLH